MKLDFGYFDTDIMINTSNFIISKTTDKYSKAIHDQADKDGWITARSISNRIFGLPKNYQIDGNFVSDEHARFIVWCLSFFFGVRLSTFPREFLDATNIQINNAFGFLFLNNSDVKIALELAYSEFIKNDIENNKRICSIIHLLFMSRNKFYLQFERFIHTYMAIDGCYKFLKVKYMIKSSSHKERIKTIANWAGIDIPSGFDDIPDIRNELFHEGLFVNKPLGYFHCSYNLLFLNNFICKVLFKILNINAPDYISRAKCETRDMVGVTVIP